MNASTNKSRPLWRWTTSGVWLALGAALFTALTYVCDTYVTHNVITQNAGWAGTFVYLTLGGWVGVISNFLYNRFISPRLDPSFSKETWLQGKALLYTVIAGIVSAISTGAYLSVAGRGDPSILIALLNFSMIYLVVYDARKSIGKTNWVKGLGIKIFWASCVLIGAGLASVTSPTFWVGFSATIETLILLVGVSAGTAAIGYILMDKAIKEENQNPVNIAFWRFLFLAISGTVISIGAAIAMGIWNEYLHLLTNIWWIALPFIALTMVFAYAQNTLGTLAQKYDNASTVLIIKTANVALALPVTLLAVLLFPGKFDFPTNEYVIYIRIVGAILITIGIAAALIIRTKESTK